MSADVLREAAGQIRADWTAERGTPWERDVTFHLAVAQWLEHAAGVYDFEPSPIEYTEYDDAITVARAYLGAEAPA